MAFGKGRSCQTLVIMAFGKGVTCQTLVIMAFEKKTVLLAMDIIGIKLYAIKKGKGVASRLQL